MSRHLDDALAAIDAALGDCGHDMGLDPHDADELGDSQTCADCCTADGCKTSVAPLPATDTSAAGAGWLPAPIDPSGQDGSANPASLPVPAADTTDTTKGETR